MSGRVHIHNLRPNRPDDKQGRLYTCVVCGWTCRTFEIGGQAEWIDPDKCMPCQYPVLKEAE